MFRVLLIDDDPNHAERLATRLRQDGFEVSIIDGIQGATQFLQQRLPACDLVLVAAARMPDRWLGILRSLVDASQQACKSVGPLFLFASRERCTAHVRLRVELLGVRYVRA